MWDALERDTDGILQLGSMRDALQRLGFGSDQLRGRLVVDSPIVLAPHVVLDAGGAYRLAYSRRVDDFKRWIGVADAEIDAGLITPQSIRPALSPDEIQRLWSRDQRSAFAETDAAAHWYLFGRARDAAAYQRLLERLRGPFHAALFVLDELHVTSRGALTIEGLPTALAVRNVHIEPGGTVSSYTVLRADVEKITRSA
ncbi:MAG TPA: hypothetical protein VGP41_04805 [Candidatus Lustribacter sp.]|jgi:hypothetical protein|nr:hypothetical protein [Candidatus Lustribacter sp.]